VTPANYYVPGTGAPAISTADYYHENGLYGLRPYDLTKSACGAVGARIAQTNGRYAWVIEQDHNSINTNWANGNDHYIGFSNDPGILPDPSAMIPIDRFNSILSPAPGATFTGTIANPPGTQLNITAMTDGAITLGDTISGTGVTTGTVITAGVSGIGQTGTYTLDRSSTGATGSVAMTATQFNVGADYFPYLVCNPDDTTNPFYIYNQVHYNSGQYDTGPILSSDLSQQSSYVLYGDAFRSFRPNNSLARAMQIQRTGVGAWKAIGLTGVPDFSNNEANGLWTSSDGRYFSFSGTFLNSCLPPATGGSFDIFCDFANVGGSNFAINTLPDGFVTPVGGQNYLITAEASGWNATTNTTGLYATLVPVDANYSIISSPSPIRISDVIGPEGGVSFPGPI
jgi:hypothetical protein